MTLPLAIWTTGSPVPSAEEKHGNFFRMIAEPVRAGFSGEILDINSVECPKYPEPSSVCGIIVSGSPARIASDEKWMRETKAALQLAHRNETPILGICFGHQLLGEALGGVVGVNPNGREIGTVDLVSTGTPDPLFDPIEAKPTIVMTHLDSVLSVPEGTKVLHTTSLEDHAALRFSDTTWGVQFHPEMDADIIGCYLRERRNDIESEGLDVEAIVRARTDSSFGADLLARFARFCASGSFDH